MVFDAEQRIGATGTAVPAALEELVLLLRRWLNGDYEAGRDRLETLLATIRRGDGGRLLSALETQHNGLASGTEAVRQRLTDPPLCYRKRPSPQGLIFETVIRKYFIGEVQPWSVQIARRVQLLGEPIARLEKMLEDVTPPAYRDWRRYRDSLMSSGVEAPRQHALAVAELLDVCGLRPG